MAWLKDIQEARLLEQQRLHEAALWARQRQQAQLRDFSRQSPIVIALLRDIGNLKYPRKWLGLKDGFEIVTQRPRGTSRGSWTLQKYTHSWDIKVGYVWSAGPQPTVFCVEYVTRLCQHRYTQDDSTRELKEALRAAIQGRDVNRWAIPSGGDD